MQYILFAQKKEARIISDTAYVLWQNARLDSENNFDIDSICNQIQWMEQCVLQKFNQKCFHLFFIGWLQLNILNELLLDSCKGFERENIHCTQFIMDTKWTSQKLFFFFLSADAFTEVSSCYMFHFLQTFLWQVLSASRLLLLFFSRHCTAKKRISFSSSIFACRNGNFLSFE